MDTEILVLPRSRSAVVTATTSFRAPDGTAAIPGYSFTNETTSGIRRVSSKVFRWGANTEATFIEIDGNTNGNITLTQSGTAGNLVLNAGATSGKIIAALRTDINSTFVVSGTAGLTGNWIGMYGNASNGGATTIYADYAVTPGQLILGTFSNRTNQLVLDPSGNVLIGTATNGTGKLQFPAATTSAGGITLGTNNFYQEASGIFALGTTSNAAAILKIYANLGNNNSVIDFRPAGSGSGLIQVGGTAALTLDSSQNATFAGFVRPVNLATVSAPAYAKGVIYFDTTLNKLRVGGATAFETITSA